jgi:predicted phage baseplate assembly protein
LNSNAEAVDFVVEVDDDGTASLRFGDGEYAQRPAAGTAFTAIYRIGNGSAGNVGAESIAHVIGSAGEIAAISAVRNPLAASGGVDPESLDSVRRNAPEAFRVQERAVTPPDYAAVTERHSGVQRAAATPRWTGSWHTMFITVDAQAGVDSTALKADLEPFVDRYRMAGQDLEFNDPYYVSLEIDMHVCVQPDYFRSEVKKGLQELFSAHVLPDGRRALFHPDNFTFGQTVYLGPLYAAAHAVPGVASVQISTFQRQGTDDPTYLADGRMPLGRLEIARLENSLNYPEHGVLRLDINGGK